MPNRTLALDIGDRMLRAALVETTLRTQRVVGVYAVARTRGGDLASDVRALAAAWSFGGGGGLGLSF